LAGANLKKVYFGNSGSEGVEAALKFAMAFTGRGKFIAFEGAFHGFTLGALALAGSEGLKRPFPTFAIEAVQVPFGDLEAVEQQLRGGDVAGVVLEPVQGMTGAKGWESEDLLALQALCRRYGTAVILDEVLTGIGRTGKWFAFQHAAGFEPDIVVVSKGLTGGAVPVSATLMTDEIYDAVFRGLGRAEIHASTFEAHLLGAAAGSAVIEVIKEEGLLEQVNAMSARIVAGLRGMGSAVTDVRGLGLMLSFGVDDSFDHDKEIWGAPGLRGRLLAEGVLTTVAAQDITRINLLPPFTLKNADGELFLTKMDALLE
jgi:acetylornithine/succinyldiaminopimelate/putrescine aminotransferase